MFKPDLPAQWLQQELNAFTLEQPTAATVVVLDENTSDIHTATESANTLFISNRFDVHQRLHARGINTCFSDFDTRGNTPSSVDALFYRLSKEKPVVHHIINSAQRLLKTGGQLYLTGLKSEGAKNFLEKAAAQLGSTKVTRKQGAIYTVVISKAQGVLPAPLDDQDYHQLRPISSAPEFEFVSKPGLFGWQKIDAGSRFLIDSLQALQLPTPAHMLDLGCGYGYLTVRACRELFTKAPDRLTLTDNNAGALIAALANLKHHELNGQVIAADVGDSIDAPADFILCNPPFHQGFSVSGDLTDKFLQATKRLLAPQGQAFFVVNSFIGLEQKAEELFGQVNILANNRQFKVVALRKNKKS
ncbi:MAG TPA: methyltransferase [Cellvibrionaceae bacterium]